MIRRVMGALIVSLALTLGVAAPAFGHAVVPNPNHCQELGGQSENAGDGLHEAREHSPAIERHCPE